MVDERARIHGGVPADAAARASDANAVGVDFSTCVDAFGLFEPVEQALRDVEQSRAYTGYPDPESRLARRRLAALLDVEPDAIDVGPGAAEQIWTLVRACLRLGERALAWVPCFSEFAHAVAALGGQLSEHRWGDGALDQELAAFDAAVAQTRPKLVYLCAPTCPRGQWVPAALLRAVIAEHPATTFIVDQSYLGLSRHAAERNVYLGDNAVRLRSVTKELGLPGVRVGYALMAPVLRRRLQSERPHWALGTHAQAVLEVYDQCQPALAARRSLLLGRAAQLVADLSALGLRAELRDTHYFVVVTDASPPRSVRSHPADGLGGAAEVTRQLRERAVFVRDCASFGLSGHVRVVAHPEQARLIAAWADILGGFSAGATP